ncbi:MAG: hypothetical protein H6765_03295 [Candidatus Peribacteria bacterium]|nr:MAG: hypothetical protein H6765_03295 [Candidatus Peribacteria bacterium]
MVHSLICVDAMVAKKKPTTNKKTSASNDQGKKGIVKPEEKQKLIDELKSTMHDLGRLPGLVVAPVIAFVSSKYEHIPEKRREKLAEIVHNLREEGTG